MDYADFKAGMKPSYFTQSTQGDLINGLRMALPLKARILVVGVGSGEELKYLRTLAQRVHVTVIDRDPRVKFLLKNSDYDELIIQDACEFKAKKKFDLVVCFDVAEHVRRDYQLFLNLYHALNQGGYLAVTVPAHQWLFGAHDKALGHFRRYSKRELRVTLPVFDELLLSYRYCFLSPVVLLSKLLGKFGRPRVQAPTLPKWLNRLAVQLMKFEYYLMGYGFSLPFGVSLVYCGVKR